ncbi:hypothetical protein [Hydrogenophaga sp. IBVHS1]|uniref:hypothetical protein n=1 Tax=unclassified Hydrogenophaga TaxID=2610897 RepID=UPI000A328831|nr:hypothetical protein [Hydrogenophaga sp. IBVHS1]
MNTISLALLLLCLLASPSARADECAFLPKGDPKIADLADSVDYLECRALTDKTRNEGKPLTVHQLEQIRMEFESDKTYKDTIWMRLRLATLNKKIDCMIASGRIEECHCLAERLPVQVAFVDYLRIITSAPGLDSAQFGLSQTDFSRLSGMVWSVRDQCLATQRIK